MYVAVKTKRPNRIKNEILFRPITVTKGDKATCVLTTAMWIFQFFNDIPKRVTSYWTWQEAYHVREW